VLEGEEGEGEGEGEGGTLLCFFSIFEIRWRYPRVIIWKDKYLENRYNNS
jgi:hypothetical protein